jgi:hypothetical protein
MAWVARTAGALLAICLAAGTAGCTHPCLKLAEQICACEPGQIERETCEKQMKSAFDAARPDELDTQASVCSELIDTCDCHALDTEAGRQACGLARAP